MEHMRKAKPKKQIVNGARRQGCHCLRLACRPPPRAASATAAAAVSLESASLADAQRALGLIKSRAGLDLTEKVKDLLRLAKEQGHLTYDDVNDALPDDIVTSGRSGSGIYQATEPRNRHY